MKPSPCICIRLHSFRHSHSNQSPRVHSFYFRHPSLSLSSSITHSFFHCCAGCSTQCIFHTNSPNCSCGIWDWFRTYSFVNFFWVFQPPAANWVNYQSPFDGMLGLDCLRILSNHRKYIGLTYKCYEQTRTIKSTPQPQHLQDYASVSPRVKLGQAVSTVS